MGMLKQWAIEEDILKPQPQDEELRYTSKPPKIPKVKIVRGWGKRVMNWIIWGDKYGQF